MNDEQGLYRKYQIRHKDGTPVDGKFRFVLSPERDPSALAALRLYASVTENEHLRIDLERQIKHIERMHPHLAKKVREKADEIFTAGERQEFVSPPPKPKTVTKTFTQVLTERDPNELTTRLNEYLKHTDWELDELHYSTAVVIPDFNHPHGAVEYSALLVMSKTEEEPAPRKIGFDRI